MLHSCQRKARFFRDPAKRYVCNSAAHQNTVRRLQNLQGSRWKLRPLTRSSRCPQEDLKGSPARFGMGVEGT